MLMGQDLRGNWANLFSLAICSFRASITITTAAPDMNLSLGVIALSSSSFVGCTA